MNYEEQKAKITKEIMEIIPCKVNRIVRNSIRQTFDETITDLNVTLALKDEATVEQLIALYKYKPYFTSICKGTLFIYLIITVKKDLYD